MANGSTAPPSNWVDLGRAALAIAAAVLLIGAVVFAVVSVRYHQVVTVTVRGHVKTTVTGPPGPSVGLISATLGAGVALLLLAVFFNRATELSLPGGISIKLGARVARKAAEAAPGDPEKIAKIYEQVAPQVAIEDYVRRQQEIARQRRARLRARAEKRGKFIVPSSMDELIDTLTREAAQDIGAAKDVEAAKD